MVDFLINLSCSDRCPAAVFLMPAGASLMEPLVVPECLSFLVHLESYE